MRKFMVMIATMLCGMLVGANAVSFGYTGKAYEPVSDGAPLDVHIVHQSDPNLTCFGEDTEGDNWYLKAIEEQLNVDIIYDQMIPSANYYVPREIRGIRREYADHVTFLHRKLTSPSATRMNQRFPRSSLRRTARAPARIDHFSKVSVTLIQNTA